jgi:hypothetical protein
MFPNKNISIDRVTYERLRSFQQARRALSMRFESLSACISALLDLADEENEAKESRRAFTEAFEGRPSDIGDVYEFADDKGICESTAHAFFELNEKKSWKGMKNWKGALIAFSKVDKP